MVQLFWKTDRELLQQLVKDLPSKYILGRYRAATRSFHRNPSVTIVWKGYTFSISQKALKRELFQRKDIELYYFTKQHLSDVKYFVTSKPNKIKKY